MVFGVISSPQQGKPGPQEDRDLGEQATEEMLALYLHYRWSDETVANQKAEFDALMQQGLLMGVLDHNLDGKLEMSEQRASQAAPSRPISRRSTPTMTASSTRPN
jgi:hypothetical protein